MKIPFDSTPTTGAPTAFIITGCMASDRFPKLTVTIKANGHIAGEWILGPIRQPQLRSIEISAQAIAQSRELILTFEIPETRSPATLGWSSDPRPLGIRIARAVIGSRELEIPAFEKLPPAHGLVERILGLPAFALHVARLLAKAVVERYLSCPL